MVKRKRLILSILIKEEQISYLVGVPLAVYIVLFCGNFQGEQIVSLLMGVCISAVMVSPLRFLINYRRMSPLLKKLLDESSDENTLALVKEKLFKEPRLHALSIALAWLFATSISFLVAHMLSGLTMFHLFVLALIWTVTIPSGYIISYFIAEKGLIGVLSENRIAPVEKFNRRQFSIVKKVVISLSILAWYPTVVLSFILFEMNMGIVVLTNIRLHVGFIIFMMLLLLASICYLLITSLKATLGMSIDGLRELSRGNLSNLIPEITCDEMGAITKDINKLARNLRKMVTVSMDMVSDINTDSKKFLKYMEEMSDGSMTVASSMEQVSAALEELGASSDSIEANSMNHSTFVKKVDEFVNNLFVTIEHFAEKASRAVDISREAMRRVEKGNEVLNDTQRYVHDINESSRKISQSVDVIKDIADQVNLLSLNASIEAARAGEHGRGFSVVAEEISKLADTTQQNADNIIKTINEILGKVNNEIKAMELLIKSFGDIQNYIDETSEFMNEISRDVVQQKDMSGEIRSLFSELSKMATENMNAVQEQSRAHREIVSNVSSVSDMMAVFTEKMSFVRIMSSELALRANSLLEGIKIFKVV